MISRFRILLFLCTVVVGSSPALLHADHTGQMPQKPTASSFLLVASKQMNDPRFRKTVIVVTSDGNIGPIGVIVNRPKTSGSTSVPRISESEGIEVCFMAGQPTPEQSPIWFVAGKH